MRLAEKGEGDRARDAAGSEAAVRPTPRPVVLGLWSSYILESPVGRNIEGVEKHVRILFLYRDKDRENPLH